MKRRNGKEGRERNRREGGRKVGEGKGGGEREEQKERGREREKT